jgi:hypothetical protein
MGGGHDCSHHTLVHVGRTRISQVFRFLLTSLSGIYKAAAFFGESVLSLLVGDELLRKNLYKWIQNVLAI